MKGYRDVKCMPKIEYYNSKEIKINRNRRR